jgi:hypothetical protein
MSRSDTTSGTGADLTADDVYGTVLGDPFVAPADGIYKLGFNLSNLANSAANFTVHGLHLASDGSLIRRFSGFESKWIPTETVFGDDLLPIVMQAGDKLAIAIYSSNAGDDHVSWRRVVINSIADVSVGATVVGGYTVTLNDAPAWTTAGGQIVNLRHAQFATVSYTYNVVDSSGSPADLDGDELLFVVHDKSGTVQFSYSTEDHISVSGGTVVVEIQEDDVDEVDNLLYELRNLTDGKVPLASGRFDILMAPLP